LILKLADERTLRKNPPLLSAGLCRSSLSHSFGLFSIIDNNAAFTHHAIEWRELRRLEQAFFAP
jgi:hypothetical protein